MSKPNLVGGRLFSVTQDEFMWVQWVKGKRSTLKDTNFSSTHIPKEHEKYHRIKAVFDLLVNPSVSPFFIDLTQPEWEQLINHG
ncbi:hypothetical protein D3C87_1230770 [compost metagenome]